MDQNLKENLELIQVTIQHITEKIEYLEARKLLWMEYAEGLQKEALKKSE